MGAESEEKQFVRRLMMAHCECGSEDFNQYLNLPEDHGVYFQDVDHPLMNANDHEAKKHIMQFGRCQAESNPKNVMSDVLSKINPVFAMIDKAKDAMGSEGCKCSPKVINSWEHVDKANRLDGAPAITNKSVLHCFYGGKITITEITPDPDANKDQAEQQDQEESNIMDTLPKAMQDKINNMNQNAASQGEGGEGDSAGGATGDGGAGGSSGGGTSGGTGGASGGAATGSMGTALGGAAESALTGGMGEMSGLISDTRQWYQDNAQDFMEMYAVSDALIGQNYMNNRSQVINPACFNEEGFIADASLLYNFNMGGSNVSRIGGSCVAEYNMMQALGEPMELCDIIRGAERRQTISGFMDGGPMGVSLCSMADGMRAMGRTAGMVCGRSAVSAAMNLGTGEAAVLGISDNGKTQFCTLQCGAAGKVRCAEHPKLSVEALCSHSEGKQLAMLKVGCVNNMTSKKIR